MIAEGRDTVNACALGMVVGAVMEVQHLSPGSGVLTGLSWADLAQIVDNAAEALDAWVALNGGPSIWEMTDWFLTLDRVALELFTHVDDAWTTDRIHACIVLL